MSGGSHVWSRKAFFGEYRRVSLLSSSKKGLVHRRQFELTQNDEAGD